MHNKKKLFKKVVLDEQSYNHGLVNDLEQLSHIAIVSFTRALLFSLVPFSYEYA